MLATPSVLVRITGMAPLGANLYERQQLRCNLCGEVFVADAPEGVGHEKYDETAASMVGLLKYGAGMPFNRIEKLQGNLGIPLPAATQWEVVERAAGLLMPAHQELIDQAAQGELLHNDDTTAKILELMAESEAEPADGEEEAERTGIFTTGIVAEREGHRIALFLTGRQHAGENLRDVLSRRRADLQAPIQMCDALSRNLPGELKTVLANCWCTRVGASSRWSTIFPTSAGTCSKSCARCTRPTTWPGSRGYRPRTGCACTRSRAARAWLTWRCGYASRSSSTRSSPTPGWARPSGT
jgi:hypothetical protein